ncbi:putative uncharacterized protein DDB_G0287975 [Dendrobium catenatum]|uniref:Uncharacterized protein n=1 Tax=Dendrobium catenatum TaxID=906689 RepID=A0A2I0VLB7_9ASPA|nr:putative uncharacterized protein DDB_G0287975 [Dendrobium catenatum]PKU64197.1 hypothetical protein MA16_Dca005120 [Dendrobium catenatum]
MQIRLKCTCQQEECREWSIIELQGVVESHPSLVDHLQNLEIGRLCCVSEGNYTFTVGYHELSGTKMALKKPLLVLKKKKVGDAFESDSSDSSGVELEVIGIIRHRILFKTRPMALISKPLVKDKKNL